MQEKVLKLPRGVHMAMLAAILVILAVLHYSASTGGMFSYSTFGLTRHTIDRILFLIPSMYAAMVLGFKAAMITLAVTAAIMFPRVFILSASPRDALVETIGVILIGLLVNGFTGILQSERVRRNESIDSLQDTREKLLRHQHTLTTLHQVSHALNQIQDINQSLENAVKHIVGTLEFDFALVFAVDEERKGLDLIAHHGVSSEFAEGIRRMGIGEGLNGRVAESGELLLVNDTMHDPRLTRDVVVREKVLAQLIVPVKTMYRTLGTLSVGVKSRRQFSADEIQMLSAIAEEIGIALDNARLYREQRMDTERLRQSEQDYRDLFEKAHDGIWVSDMSGNIIDINGAAARMLHSDRDSLLNTNMRSLLDDEGIWRADSITRALANGEQPAQPYEQRFIRPDSSVVFVMLATSLLSREREPVRFQHIARDITEEKRLNENLRFYVLQITRAQEEERKRIARELHDETAQELVVLSRRIDGFISQRAERPVNPATIEMLQEEVTRILDGVRRFSQDLRPSILDDLGLIPAVEWFAGETTEHFHIPVSVKTRGTVRRLAPEKELLMFRVIQEALSNVRKHSRCQNAHVDFDFTADTVTVAVRDDGIGFNLPDRPSHPTGTAKLGLMGMAERARLIGGQLTIDSAPGKGATVTLQAPV